MSDDLDLIGFDLPRDTEKGVRCLEEQVEDNEVPTEIIQEMNLRTTHCVLHGRLHKLQYTLPPIQLINTSSVSFILLNLPYNFPLTSLYLCVLFYF